MVVFAGTVTYYAIAVAKKGTQENEKLLLGHPCDQFHESIKCGLVAEMINYFLNILRCNVIVSDSMQALDHPHN